MIYQGPVVVRFLVESLINADNAADRLKIIDLLTYSPDYLPSLVHERLQEHMVWYGKRNLIKLLGETGTEEDAKILLPTCSMKIFGYSVKLFWLSIRLVEKTENNCC